MGQQVGWAAPTNQPPVSSPKPPILIASIGDLHGILTNAATQALAPPTQADLSETIEVQFTQEIRDLSASLQNNPVKIYEWVRNNIEFVPTYGSIQGANMCLQTKQCNAFDTASLLIAILRTSNIPARYVYGTIEVPIDKVMNWAGGFTDANSALGFIASGGIPVNGLISGGKISAAQIEHVWVEAYVGYGPYSGRPSKLNPPKTWMPLDSSFKQYNYTQGIDLQTAVPFDAQSFLNQIKSTATINETESYVTNVDSNYIQTTLTNYQTQLQNYISQNMPNATAGDIIGKKEIIKQEFGILSATLPYETVTTGNKYSEIPDNLRHRITFEIQDPNFLTTSLSYTATIPELTGKRITLSYAPATATDEQTINSYGGIYNVPAYLINMKPLIKVEGVVKASGSSIGLGNQQTFDMTFTIPGFGSDIVSNKVTAGAYYGIGLNPNKIPKKLIEQRKAKLESVKDTINQSNIYTDDYIGELLYTTATLYFFELDAFESVFASSYKIANIKQVAEGIVAKDLTVSYSFGVPIKANEGSMIIDVDRYIHSPFSKSGDKTKEQQFMLGLGQMSSGMEHGIFEQLYKKPGTSAIKALSVANNQGIPIYTINKDNIGGILPVLQVSPQVKTDIQNAVNAGKTVTVPKTNIAIDTWAGVGYILFDPNTGAGAYMISGGFAGGGSDVSNIEIIAKWLLIAIAALAIVGLIEAMEGLITAISITLVESLIAALFVTPILLIAIIFILIAAYLIFKYVILPNITFNKLYRYRKIYTT